MLLPEEATTSKPALASNATAALPTPPDAPVTRMGPSSIVVPWRTRRRRDRSAVQPARPMMAAVRQRQGVGQRDDPVGRDPRVGGEPAVAVHAEVVALHQDALPRREVGARALLDASGELHAGDEWEDPRHSVPRPGHHGVLEVDGGPLDPDEDVTRGKVGVGELDHCGPDDRPRLGEQVGRETHRLTVEGRAGGSGRSRLQRVRSDRDHDCRVWALEVAARGG